MDQRAGSWQQRYESARPPRVLLWCAARRRLVRALLAVLVALTVGLLVWAVREGAALLSPILNVLVFGSQLALWGFAVPRQVDEWEARQAARENTAEP